MTVSAPTEPMLPPRRRPWGILVLVVALLAVIGYLAFSSVGNALVYYLTPTELLARGDAAVGQTVRQNVHPNDAVSGRRGRPRAS